MAERKNILFITADQMRADCLTGVLAGHADLPNLRALMDEAVTFQNHFAVTSPCGPSRASLMTGLYAMNHRSVRNGVPLSSGITNVAREARKAGYEPMLFGYTDTSLDPRDHHPSDPAIRTYEQVLPGLDEVVEMRGKRSFPWRAHLKAQGYDLPDYEAHYHPVSADPGRPAMLGDPAFYAAEDSDTAFLTDRLLAELAVRDSGWFTCQSYVRPHPPFVAPKPYNTLYAPDELPLPARLPSRSNEASVHPFMAALLEEFRLERYVDGLDDLISSDSDGQIQLVRATYLGLISEVDRHVGRILDFLKETDQYDSTLIIFTSDHGEMLGDRYMWGKETVYDETFHVPLIVRDPRRPDAFGARVDALTEAVDIAPTLLNWTGQRVPASMNGRSLLPFLEGKQPGEWRDHVFFELDFGDPQSPTLRQQAMAASLREANLSAIREERFKLVHFNGGHAPLLFDLQSEEGEMRDLAADPDQTETVLRLTRKLLDHRMRHADHTLSDMKVTSAGTINYDLDI